jgi:hypothetical protein
MEPPMEYLSAPRANLETWHRVVKLFTTLTIFVALLLAVLAITLLH